MQLSRKCPRCSSPETTRSHRKLWEHLIFFMKPYRCNNCQHRFYHLPPPSPRRAL